MTRLLDPILALLATASPLWAASPDYCRPYARDFVESLQHYEWDRAYAHCLNSDEDPAQPETWDEAMRMLDYAPPIDLAKIGTVPATGLAVTKLSPDQICSNAHLKIIWRGKSWRCSR